MAEGVSQQGWPTAGLITCDRDAIPDLLTSVSSLGARFRTEPADEETRLSLLRAARKLWLALETPREAMTRHSSVDPSTVLALTAGSEAGVWEHLATNKTDEPFHASDVADAVRIDPKLLSRLLRHLAAADYLREVGPDTFERTLFTKAMGNPSLGGCYPALSTYAMPAYNNFHAYAKTVDWQTPTDPNNGNYQHALKIKKNYLDYIQAQPDGYRFAEHMAVSNLGRPSWTDPGFYPTRERLQGSKPDEATIVDVGGSTGHDLVDLAAKYPDLQGRFILQDLPVVLQNVAKSQLDPRIDVMAHDFFQKQPVQGARAYFLHSILHDWPDDACVQILSNIVPAMTPRFSKILIYENVIPDTGAHWEATGYDIAMLALLSGAERTLSAWRALISKAGLVVTGIWTAGLQNSQSIIECEVGNN